MLVQSPEGKMEVIDFREVAPGDATRDMFGKERSASVTVTVIKMFVFLNLHLELEISLQTLMKFTFINFLL